MTGFTDRSRTSGEYLLDLAMGLFLKQRTGKPGAIQFAGIDSFLAKS
jgi:hypothetical protein